MMSFGSGKIVLPLSIPVQTLYEKHDMLQDAELSALSTNNVTVNNGDLWIIIPYSTGDVVAAIFRPCAFPVSRHQLA